jgi:hypothetical protein
MGHLLIIQTFLVGVFAGRKKEVVSESVQKLQKQKMRAAKLFAPRKLYRIKL